MKRAICLLLPVILLGCSDEVAGDAVSDPSKMSDELERRASEIEEKAEMAVLVAEREAGAELASLREESATVEQEQETPPAP